MTSVSRKGAIAPIVIGLLGATVLCMLGAWQTQRLAWKTDLITEIEERMAADPAALPPVPDAQKHNLLRVRVSGVLEPEELHVLHSIKRYGPGFRVVVPMVLDGGDGRRILVDLGFIPQRFQNPEDRPAGKGRPYGVASEVVGLLLWPNEADQYTPEPDRQRRIWFARDVEAMARALATEPVLLVAASHAGGDLPVPQPPGANVPNRHLEYAVTWFSLAAIWAVMSIVWLRMQLRRPVVSTKD